jgi:hypothetical protein
VFRTPADAAARLLGAFWRQIGDSGNFQARSRRDLRQEHRPELAGTDQSDAYGVAGSHTFLQQAIQVHEGPPTWIIGSILQTLSGKGDRGRKPVRARRDKSRGQRCPGNRLWVPQAAVSGRAQPSCYEAALKSLLATEQSTESPRTDPARRFAPPIRDPIPPRRCHAQRTTRRRGMAFQAVHVSAHRQCLSI